MLHRMQCKQGHQESLRMASVEVLHNSWHHLRFDRNSNVESRAQPTFSALRVEGAFRNPAGADSWEYSVVVSIRNDRGEEVARKVVGVGALDPRESRTVTLSVDVFAPRGSK